jgi:4-amino-4-deoxy-L-arabinose transferase-like glycosyltransferase
MTARKPEAIVWRSDVRTKAATFYPYYFLPAMTVILLASAAVRFWQLGLANLWTDEVTTALRVHAPMSVALDSLSAAGNQTPLYFLLLRLIPNETEAQLRLPSAVFGVLGVALLINVVLKLYNDYDLALVAGALLALNPFHIWLSRNARQYSMLFVLSLAATYFFLMLIRGNQSRRNWIGYLVTTTLAFSLHYTAAALLVPQFLLLIRTARPLFWRWLMVQAFAAVFDVIWFGIVLFKNMFNDSPNWIPHPALVDIPITLWNLLIGFNGQFEIIWVPFMLISALGLLLGITSFRSEEDRYWLWLGTVPLMVFVWSRFGPSGYVDRYFMVVLPALLMLLIYGLRRLPVRLYYGAVGLIILGSTLTVVTNFAVGSFKRTDWTGASAHVAENFQENDAILFDRENVADSFMRYFYRSGSVSSIRLDDTPDSAAFGGSVNRIWVVYRNPVEDVHTIGLMPDFDPFANYGTPIARWVSDHKCRVQEVSSFNGVKVLLLSKEKAELEHSPRPCSSFSFLFIPKSGKRF